MEEKRKKSLKIRKNPKKSPIRQLSSIKIKKVEKENSSKRKKTISKLRINQKKSPIRKLINIKVKKTDARQRLNIKKTTKPPIYKNKPFENKLKHKNSPVKNLVFFFRKQKSSENIDKELIDCPYCNKIIPLPEKISDDIIINCFYCDQTFTVQSPNEKIKKTEKKTKIKKNKFILYKPSFKAKMLSMILTVIGLIFLINPNPFNIKLSITFIIVGITIFTIVTDKKLIITSSKKIDSIEELKLIKRPNIKKKINEFIEKPFDIYDKIAISSVILVLFLFIVAGDVDIEIFLILIYIGFLMIKEFTKEYTPNSLKKRMNILFFVFLAIFIVVITKRIISILNI